LDAKISFPVKTYAPDYRKHRSHKDFVMRLDNAFSGMTPATLADELLHQPGVTFL
jgi:hypothetical protein